MKKILVPIDGSQNSFKALKHARNMAEKFGSEIILVNIQKPIFYESLEPEPVSSENGSETIQERAKIIINQGLEILKGSPVSIKPELKTEIIAGEPAEQILYLIDKEDVDMVIMGSHGLSGIRRFLMGSVSNKVLQHSSKPVMIIK